MLVNSQMVCLRSVGILIAPVVVFVGGWQNDTLDFKSKTQHTLITRHASQDGRRSEQQTHSALRITIYHRHARRTY